MTKTRNFKVIASLVLILVMMVSVLAVGVSAEDNYTVSFAVPAGVTAVDSESVAPGGSVTLPGTLAVPAGKDGYEFAGWATESVTGVSEATILTGEYTPTGSVTLYPVYRKATGSEAGYELVTDAVKAGDKIVIAASESAYALSTTQKSNNRSATAITKNADGTITISADTQIITVEAGTTEGTFAFNVGDAGYLYAASSSGNQLKSKTALDANGSWKITIADGVATIIAQGSNSRNDMRYNYNNGTPLFACYASTSDLEKVSIYREFSSTTYEYDSLLCTHNYVATPDAENAGYHNYVCGKCDDTYSEACTGETTAYDTYKEFVCDTCGYSVKYNKYTVTFSAPAGITVDADSAYAGESVTLPEAEAPEGYTFFGWSAATVDNVTDRPEVLKAGETYVVNANTTLYATYTYVEGTSGGSEWILKDITDITSKDKFVITMTTSDGTVYALSSANGSSSAPTAKTVTVSGEKLTAKPADDLIWNLGGSAGAYIFYPNGTTETWLYCTSSNNGVRVGTNANKEFAVGETHLFNNTTGRYVGVYTTNPDWRCYTSINTNITGQTLGFYVETAAGTSYYTTVIEGAGEDEVVNTAIKEAAIKIGSDLSMLYYVNLGTDYTDAAKLSMKFTMNGKITEVTSYEEIDGAYVFEFAGISPDMMGAAIDAELYYDGDKIDEDLGYSVKDNAQYLLNEYSDNEKLVRLVTDLLYYGAAAQAYKGDTTTPVTEGVTGMKNVNTGAATEADYVMSVVGGTTEAYFAEAGVWFDYNNKIFAKIVANGNVTVTVNSVAAEVINNGNGTYTVYTDGIAATDFADEYVFVLSVDGEEVATLTYSVNSYVYAMRNSTNDAMVALAKALYNYGASASAYQA